MNRRGIAEYRVSSLKSGPLRTTSHITRLNSRDYVSCDRRRNLSEFLNMLKTLRVDGLRYPPIDIVIDEIAEGLTLHDVVTTSWGGGASLVVVS